jgi:hypothetical protein
MQKAWAADVLPHDERVHHVTISHSPATREKGLVNYCLTASFQLPFGPHFDTCSESIASVRILFAYRTTHWTEDI